MTINKWHKSRHHTEQRVSRLDSPGQTLYQAVAAGIYEREKDNQQMGAKLPSLSKQMWLRLFTLACPTSYPPHTQIPIESTARTPPRNQASSRSVPLIYASIHPQHALVVSLVTLDVENAEFLREERVDRSSGGWMTPQCPIEWSKWCWDTRSRASRTH